MPETGGAATFTRRAFNDLIGFVTGWALFLDYLIVIALSALFLPHYVGAALEIDSLRDRPWDVVVAVGAIALIGMVRLIRQHAAAPARARRRAARPRRAVPHRAARARARLLAVDVVDGLSLAPGQDWLDDLLFAIPLGFLAYTGLETVANLAEEAREPGRDPAPLAVLGDRARRRPDRPRRDRRGDGVPVRGRASRARRRVARGAARRAS